jgi:prepilin-type N-terminal cleavage/methylation domain-containing protein/prepilin-type processing-associated H-X9-DG protein
MRKNAFTLIELLVVVAIIALLLSILLPSLSGARESAKAVVCGQHQRQFGTGIASYATENSDWFPGVNTSGVVLRSKQMALSSGSLLFNPKIPVQTYDWLTPILSAGQELPADPVQRFKFLLNTYRCPSQRYTAVVYPTSGPGFDLGRFNTGVPYSAVSYQMPYHFQAAGTANRTTMSLGSQEGLATLPLEAETAPTSWEVNVTDYVPRLNRVGPAARKICVADGTRFVRGSDELLDFDARPVPDRFGSFTSQAAWWSGSREYGVEPGSANWDGMSVNPTGLGQDAANGVAIPISYRHGKPAAARTAKANKGTINALFFDGHVSRLADRESREVHLWYPSGAVVTKPGEGMTRVEVNYVIP